jgi:hypothetical protein
MPSEKTNWAQKYELFQVPANSCPGGDLRNIQATAYCSKAGWGFFDAVNSSHYHDLCNEKTQPGIQVPVLNYPSWWVMVYQIFQDYSEQFFMKAWYFNAGMLFVTIAALCYSWNYAMMPLVIFSPISLLAIERGNIDATVFSITFLPLVISSVPGVLRSFCIGIAASLKIFPIFGYLAFIKIKKPYYLKGAVMGLLLSAPFVIHSFTEIPRLISGTSLGCSCSYGLTSITHANHFQDKSSYAYLIIAIYLISWGSAFMLVSKNHSAMRHLDEDIKMLDDQKMTSLLVSGSIFLGTFIVFSNWAYRLIFLIPAFLVLSKFKSIIGKATFINILFIFWSAYLYKGWEITNLACYSLAILLSIIIIRGVILHEKMDEKPALEL